MSNPSTYEVILDTSYRLFAEQGFEKTSMAMIAKELDVSKPALYYHFSSKEALIDKLFEEICRSIGFHVYFQLEKYTAENFSARLTSDGLNMVHTQQEDEHYTRIMNQYQALGYRNPKYARQLIGILEGFTSGFTELLEHGVSIGALPEGNMGVQAQMLTMIIDSMDNFMSYGLEYDYELIWTQAVNQVMTGAEGNEL